MNPPIEDAPPATWQDLEKMVARILRECGYEVDVQKYVELARGDVNVDVWADDHAEPPNILAIECKHWNRPVSKDVVHGFRTVVGDSGANTGLLVSSAGFQSGAKEAAAYSNVRLLTWNDFQQMYALRWFRSFMSPTIAEETDALHEYTEPINNRVFRKADALPAERQAAFAALRDVYMPLMVTNFALHPVVVDSKLSPVKAELPRLPLRDVVQKPEGRALLDALPDEVLDATALRPLMERLIHHSRSAIAEFDAIFGERA
ncbi:restriction endonuclease [Nocardioides eburneiflavus]|uniref:Restriction endonuclease n=1 Tax=Nocardioides eburneiflavus TaxID=2518372 RepID=A0A4Z1CMP7_9ACTN|nr:restriction endonuclease [Nocardioides eburneiflavus]TGN65409.1 restriction endonuclease [Nocardioides eburneiflavus]